MALFRTSLIFTFLLLALLSRAAAHQVSFLVGDEQTPAPGEMAYETIHFSLYIDPLKTNWISWSKTPQTEDPEGTTTVDADTTSGARDCPMVVSVIDPWGNRSRAIIYGARDKEGAPMGPQALIYGHGALTPTVQRFSPSGEKLLISEQGTFDPFIQKAGEGYYTFVVSYLAQSPEEPPVCGPLYLVMDVVEGFRQKPPVITARRGGLGLFLNTGSGSSSGSSSDLSGFFFPGDGGDGDDGDGDDGDGDNDPNNPRVPPTFPPVDPEEPGGPEEPGEPVVPEPGTVILIGSGLALAAGLRRRRKTR